MIGALLARLLKEPRRFRFDAAVRVLMLARGKADPRDAATFRTWEGMGYPPADILRIRNDEAGASPEVTVGMGGLTGPSGVLPRHYTEQVVQQTRNRAFGLHAFLDMLGHRMIAAFAQAGIKYRPTRSAEQASLDSRRDPHREILVSLVGQTTGAGTRPRDDMQDVLLFYAGFFAAWPRSADRLEAMLSEWVGHPVTADQFQGRWLVLPVSERTRLPKKRDPGQFARLGHDATAGARSWDPHGAVVLRIGPLPLAAFNDLMPDRIDTIRLMALARAYLGPAADFSLNPVLAKDDVPPMALSGQARIGWNTWLPSTRRTRDASEAVFPARMVERLQREQQGS